MASVEKAIGLFGGTFDPVHKGHIAITQSYLNSGYIDELWVVLTPDPPHKTGQELSDYDLRLKMLETAFGTVDRVKITDVEDRLPRPSYTVQTVRYLADRFPGYRFYLCVGEDSLINFDKWYRWEEILQYCELLVADRPNTGVNQVNSKILSRTHFIDHKPMEISSSGLRERISRGEDVNTLVPKEVYEIIRKQKLYRDQ